MTQKHITILDCTLRDGSYVIDNQFTADDTYLITTGLARAGFSLIEVGHGTGLGSYRRSKYEQAATDLAYIEAAKIALNGYKSKIGMFFIPGIGTMEDLELAAKAGLNFIRIGTDVTDIEKARPFIERAKEFGMLTCSNLMKSYAVTPKEFAVLAKKADEFGADVISIVDSAGGMFPEEVQQYVTNLKEVTHKKIGFHGHNNLHLAIANTLAAVEAGAEIIDSTLQGMGRSAGNTQTEIIVLALEKKGYSTGIDAFRTMNLGEKVVKSMMNRAQGIDDISVISGIAQFHSSFLKVIEDAATKYDVDVRELIMRVSEKNRIKVTIDLAETTAQELSHKKVVLSGATNPYNSSLLSKSDISIQKMVEIANEIVTLSKKTGKNSVLSLTLSPSNKTSFPYVRQSPYLVIGNVEAADLNEAASFIEMLDGRIDWLCLDNTNIILRESGLIEKIMKSKSTWYSEKRALNLSVDAFITEHCLFENILILSDENTLHTLKMNMMSQEQLITGTKEFSSSVPKSSVSQFKTIISYGTEFAKILTPMHADELQANAKIVSVRPDSFPSDFLNAALARGINVLRVDIRAGLNSELGLMIETKKMSYITGEQKINGIKVVAGGVIGSRGSIVLDSIITPKKVIGIADGHGGLLSTSEEELFSASKEKVRLSLMPLV